MRRRHHESMTDKNPLRYPASEHLARRPVPGSYKGLMLALGSAARELGVAMAAFGVRPCTFGPDEEVMWRLPSGVRPGPLPEKGLGPAIVRVRLPVRDPGRARAQLISAVVEAASVDWYRPTESFGVREPLASLWPQLRERGPRTEGLAEHLETVIETPGENSVEWFHHAAETAMEAAFRAGAPVVVAAELVTASGSCASIGRRDPQRQRPAPRVDLSGAGRHPRTDRRQRRRGVAARPRDRTRHSGLRPQGQLSALSDARVGRERAGHARRFDGATPALGRLAALVCHVGSSSLHPQRRPCSNEHDLRGSNGRSIEHRLVARDETVLDDSPSPWRSPPPSGAHQTAQPSPAAADSPPRRQPPESAPLLCSWPGPPR